MWSLITKKTSIPSKENALPGRAQAIDASALHCTFQRCISDSLQEGEAEILLGLGCFWGAERLFWQHHNVRLTAVGYAGGYTPNPTYQEVCSGATGHTEAVRVVYQDSAENLQALLKVFWEAHDPTQGMRQGNDVGTQYRSAIYYHNDEQAQLCLDSQVHFQQALEDHGLGRITTEIKPIDRFYYAEDYHQQYLFKNPQGYCGLKGTGVVSTC